MRRMPGVLVVVLAVMLAAACGSARAHPAAAAHQVTPPSPASTPRGATAAGTGTADALSGAGGVPRISHISAGGGYYFCSPGGGCAYAVTPTGDFATIDFMPGWVVVPLGEMYNPVFFIGQTFAIHGDTDVPLQPASHGCVRIPMDIAAFFHTMVPTPGTPV